MPLTPVACSQNNITITPTLQWPPPFIFGLGYVDPPEATHLAPFDFSPLRANGQNVAVEYFTYTLSSLAHDWAALTGVFLGLAADGHHYLWGGGEYLTGPDATYGGAYYSGSGPALQLFDCEQKALTPGDLGPSPAITGYPQYYAQPPGTFGNAPVPGPVRVYGECTLQNPWVFQIALHFAYVCDRFVGTLSYNTHATAPVVTISNLTAWCSVSGPPCQAGGDGGNNPPPPPPNEPYGIDLLYWREGYHVAEVNPQQELLHNRRWHEDVKFDYSSIIDSSRDCQGPKLSHPRNSPPLGVVYLRGDGQIYRKESYDYGETWRAEPSEGKPLKTGVYVATAEDWNERTGERMLFYLAGGTIKVDVYGPDIVPTSGLLKLNGTYTVASGADTASFGARYIRQTGAVDVVFQSGGVRKVYRSHDDARSFQIDQ